MEMNNLDKSVCSINNILTKGLKTN